MIPARMRSRRPSRKSRAVIFFISVEVSCKGTSRSKLTPSPTHPSSSNHESFVAQRATFRYYANQTAAVASVIQKFLNGHFQRQILASGEQPLESKRADGFHYQ
ncbi:hypothetical protein BC938DRAFT_473833 [Jimgerdemannia flammicorona]|uniref:Alginate lyase domain-containing protein n=1 Tax=Jimgerdemannia flammicorona TaxID=994334 RepID=A0A433Q390_9FUNG|nr:hypothetical protein BC938DRAFT_473833 [Jimgerdemannia flammicorona]